MAERLDLGHALRRFDKLLLDSCVLIDAFKRPTGRLREINRPQRVTSVGSVWEFLHIEQGRLLPGDERNNRRAWLREQSIRTLPLSPRGTKSFESLLKTEGPPSVADALLAAECLALGVPVVTSNVRHFEPVRGLRYVAW